MQTLGEEYTDIRQYSSLSKTYPVSRRIRVALVILSLFPPYALGRWGQASSLNESHPKLATWLRRIPSIFDVAMEVNLAVFYMSGTYYDPVKRLLGIQHVGHSLFISW
jgi:peroxin-10